MKRLTTSTIALALTLTSGAAIAQIAEDEGLLEEGVAIGEEGLGEPGLGEGVGLYEEYGAASGILDQGQFENMLRAENIIDSPIYSMATGYDGAEWGATEYYDELDTDWEEIGEVEDMIMSRDGNLVGIVAEVGGWLGIGDENVVLGLNDIRVVGDAVGQYAFVTRLSEERLEALPEATEGWYN